MSYDNTPKWFEQRQFSLNGRNSENKNATLSITAGGQNSNTIQFLIFTGLPGDQKPMRAEMEFVAFESVLNFIRRAIDYKPTTEAPKFLQFVETNKVKWVNSKPDGHVTDSRVAVGKDEKGIVFVAVFQNGRETIRFPFGFKEYPFARNRLLHATGEAMSAAETSINVAENYIELWKKMSNYIMIDGYKVEAELKLRGKGGSNSNNGGNNNNGGNSNGGGYNGNNNNRGGGNNDQFGDDIPF